MKRRIGTHYGAIAIVTLLAIRAVAAAQPSAVSQLITDMQNGTGVQYTAARDKILQQGSAVRDEVHEHALRARWTDASWQHDAMWAIADAWLSNPKVGQAAYQMKGLDPQVYMQWRKPAPNIAREVRAAPEFAPFLLEMALKTAAIYPFKKDGNLVQQQHALAHGALIGLAAHRHPAARFVAYTAFNDAQKPVEVRETGAIALGMLDDDAALALLERAAHEKNQDIRLIAVAIRNMGHIRTVASYTTLSQYLQSSNTLVRDAAINGLGVWGSAWVDNHNRVPNQKELRQNLSAEFVQLLASPVGAAHESTLDFALAMVADPNAESLLASEVQAQSANKAAQERLTHALEQLRDSLKRSHSVL